MIIDNSKYCDKYIRCSTCGTTYNPAKNGAILKQLGVAPLVANIFCSRKCKEAYDEFLDKNNCKNK